MKKTLFVLSLALSLATRSLWGAPGEVLILANSVTGGLGSHEAQAVSASGKVPVLASDAMWRSLTAAQFAGYDGLVLGDATCSTSLGGCVQAAIDTAMVWGAGGQWKCDHYRVRSCLPLLYAAWGTPIDFPGHGLRAEQSRQTRCLY